MLLYSQPNTPLAAVPFLQYAAAFQVAIYVLETVLDLRQHARFSPAEQLLPALEAVLDKCGGPTLKAKTRAAFAASQARARDHSAFSMARRLFAECLELAQLCGGWYPWVWDGVGGRFLAEADRGGVAHSLCFAVALQLASFGANLPFSLWHAFVVERRHGCRHPGKEGGGGAGGGGEAADAVDLPSWCADATKELALGAAVGLPLLAAALALVELAGDRWYAYVWLAALAVSLARAALVSPGGAAPFFLSGSSSSSSSSSSHVLANGDVRRVALAEQVEALAARVGYQPLHGMVLVAGGDGAAAAAQQQQQQQQQQQHGARGDDDAAYCSGGFSGSARRIVLSGSLLARATDEEVCALVARALGHWRLSHAAQSFGAAQLHAAAMLAAFDALVARRGPLASGGCVFASFGFASRPPMVGLLLFLSAVWAPIGKALSLARVALARRHAFGADAFAARLGYGAALQRALVKVHAEALCGGGGDGGGAREEDYAYLNLAPDGWYSACRFSRPTLVERIGAIGAIGATGATGGRAPAEKGGGAGEEGKPEEEAKEQEQEDGGAKARKRAKRKKKKEKQGGSQLTDVESRDRAPEEEGEGSKTAGEADDTKLKRA